MKKSKTVTLVLITAALASCENNLIPAYSVQPALSDSSQTEFTNDSLPCYDSNAVNSYPDSTFLAQPTYWYNSIWPYNTWNNSYIAYSNSIFYTHDIISTGVFPIRNGFGKSSGKVSS